MKFILNGKFILSASSDRSVMMWDTLTGDPLFALVGHEQGVCAVAASRDGKLMGTSGYDGKIRIWRLNYI